MKKREKTRKMITFDYTGILKGKRLAFGSVMEEKNLQEFRIFDYTEGMAITL